MNVYLLPHHRLDPRFRYTLEREVPPLDPSRVKPRAVRHLVDRIRHFLHRMRDDYDHLVHGHEQIRLSRLLLLMQRDPELTLVIPAGMSHDWALEAVRGVIRAGLMAHRSYVARNITTALAMMLILFFIIPTHVLAIVFFPPILIYAWRRYREDRLILRIMTQLLDERLEGKREGRFREDFHLAHLEEDFARTASPRESYQRATEYLDNLKEDSTGRPPEEQRLMHNYYRDIGRLDPYERYQDRVRKSVAQAVRAAWHHISSLTLKILGWILPGGSAGPTEPARPTESKQAEKARRPGLSQEEMVAKP